MKIFLPLVVILCILAGFTSQARAFVVPVTEDSNCLTSEQRHANDVALLTNAETQNYTLTQTGLLIQAGVYRFPTHGLHSFVVATRPKTQSMQPPHNEDPGSGGYPTYRAPGITYLSTLFPFGMYILMGCPGGGEAYTGSPPGDLQVGLGVHDDGEISNPVLARCPGAALSNCLYVWVDGGNRASPLHYFWISGRFTEPMHDAGWAWCFS